MHHGFSKQDQGTHAKVQREDSIYRGAIASLWPRQLLCPRESFSKQKNEQRFLLPSTTKT